MQITINDTEVCSAQFKAVYATLTDSALMYFKHEVEEHVPQCEIDDYVEFNIQTRTGEDVDIRVIRTI